jgi:hypothetical protein
MNMSNVEDAHADNGEFPDLARLNRPIELCFEQLDELRGCLRFVHEELRKQHDEITRLYGLVNKLDLAVTPA